MSKEAALRAMREARFNARSATSTGASKPAAPTRPAKAPAEAASDPAPTTEALCGHRSMNGRTCTRELGHAAKSHRYG